jgi:hypothetical protein
MFTAASRPARLLKHGEEGAVTLATWSSGGQVGVTRAANGGEANFSERRATKPIDDSWKRLAKHLAEIAPRRSYRRSL